MYIYIYIYIYITQLYLYYGPEEQQAASVAVGRVLDVVPCSLLT